MNDRAQPRFWVAGAVPLLLVGIGLLHSVVGILMGAATLRDMLKVGLWGSMTRSRAGPPSPSYLLWFLLTGFFMILLGHLGLWIERSLKRPLPAFFGVEFLIISAALLVVHGGAAPGWIFVGAGLWVVLVHLASRRRPAT